MSKFYISEENVHTDTIFITGDDVNHIKKVLRLRIGENVVLNNRNGTDYYAVIESFEDDRIITKIVKTEQNRTEPPIEMTLFQGIPKSDKMDFIVQKSVELGVAKVVPVITERTIVRIESKKDADNKIARWQRIAMEAAKQCNRGIIPKVLHPLHLEKAMELARISDLCIIPYEKELDHHLSAYRNDKMYKSISLMIGPEGGFSEPEIEMAVRNGIKPITLGPRILRTETAAIATLSILMHLFGDVG